MADVQNVIEETQGFLDRKVEDSDFAERVNEIEEYVKETRKAAVVKMGLWKWTNVDIDSRGQVFPGVCEVNTLDSNCVWSPNQSRIKIQSSGIYKIELFVKFFPPEGSITFTICKDDEPFLTFPSDSEDPLEGSHEDYRDGTRGERKYSRIENQQKPQQEIFFTRYLSFESGKVLSMYYDKKCYSLGLLILQQM